MKHIFFFLLIPFSAFAQPKSVAVAEYLGEAVKEQPGNSRGVPVVYTFERGAPIKRTGYGERSFTALLRSITPYSDHSLGKCMSVTVGGIEQRKPKYTERRKATQVEQASLPIENAEQADPVRPRKFTGSVQPMPENDGFGGAGISIPDSMEMVARMEGAKDQIEQWKQEAKATGQPVASFCMYLFWNAFWAILLPLGGIFWFLAKYLAAESFATVFGRKILIGRWMVDAHQTCAVLLLIDVAVCAITLLIAFYFRLVTLNIPIWIAIPIWFIAAGLTYWAAQKFTPNIESGEGRASEVIHTANNFQRRLNQ